MNAHAVKDIKVGSFFTEPVYLDGRFVIAAPEMPFTGALARALLEWEFREVLSDGESREEYVAPASSSPSAEGSEPAPVAVTAYDGDQVKRAADFYRSFHDYVENLFITFVTKNEINAKEVSEKIKELCKAA